MMTPSITDLDESYIDTTHGKDQAAARSHIKAKAPTSGPGAEKQHEDDEEDFSNMAENFSKMAEKVSKAIPRRYDESSLPAIYVVPRDLAEGTKDPYEPEAVCIGPLLDQTERRKKPRRMLESYKWCCLRKLLVNAGAGRQEQGDNWIPGVHEPLLRKCLDTMRQYEQKIRNSYGDISVGESNKLALMMLLDGSFLLHRLMVEYARLDGNSGEDDDDDWTQVVGRCGIWAIVTRDLLLLKNQIPFFILELLFEHLRGPASSDSDDVLVKGGLQLFASLHPGPGPAGSSSTITCRDVHHLLHLFYMSIGNLSHSHTKSRPRSRDHALTMSLWVPSAKELEEAGVRIRAKKQKQRRATRAFLDVSFCGGDLEIPPLELYDYSEALFRNIIAFEQTYLLTPGHVTAYALFMDCLLKTPEDMRLLHHSDVLVSHMNGERDVATHFFSRVCAQAHISWDQNYLDGVMEDLVRYHSTKWRQWRAELVRKYFRNPWATMSLVAAILVLAMTVLQTFFAVYGYYKPHGSN